MKRKLASIRTVKEVRPIKDADMIELVIVDGWQVVSKKDELKAGDLCVYFEIDSFLPIKPEYEFLRKSCYKSFDDGSEGFRLRTMTMRGQVSQGLVLPVAPIFGDDVPEIGTDVTDMLGVVKYEPPMPPELDGIAKGLFPGFITKTDEERIQNLEHYFTEHEDLEFEITIKLDGTSCTFYRREGEFGVCSRNTEWLPESNNTQWRIAKELKIQERLESYGRDLALQGEIIGESVEGNNEKIRGQEFYLFSIFDISQSRYLDFQERADVLDDLNSLGAEIKHVPIIGVAKIFKRFKTVDEMIELATGMSLNPRRNREGLVFKSRPVDDYVVTFKVIANKYLLKQKD